MQETWTENRKRSAWMTVDEYNINFYFSSKVLLCTVLYCTALTGQSDGVNAPFWDQTDQISSVSRDRVNRHVCTKRPRMKHADPEFPSGQILNATKLCLIAAHLSVSKSCVFSPGSFLFSRIARSRRALSLLSPAFFLVVNLATVLLTRKFSAAAPSYLPHGAFIWDTKTHRELFAPVFQRWPSSWDSPLASWLSTL